MCRNPLGSGGNLVIVDILVMDPGLGFGVGVGIRNVLKKFSIF
jgi:hypothetical protein